MNRHSNDERKTVLEKESSREVFETASSMSAKLTTSSSKFCRENEFTKFSFDSVLLESKVYRRAFESSWIREVSTVLEDENGSNGGETASIMSVSSNSAIASEGDCASSFRDFDLSGPEPDNIEEPPIPECSYSTAFSRPLPTLETSASSYEQTGGSSAANPTRSTLATTISCVDERTRFGLEYDKDKSLYKCPVISVVVEGIGTGSTELVVREPSTHYDKSHEAILHIRDRVLLDAGVDFSSYCGVVGVSATIQTGGQLDGHRFPLTPEFLGYVVNKLRNGSYESFSILARFASPTLSRTGPMNLTQVALNTLHQPYHFDFPPQATLPFTETSGPGDRVNGGFSSVFKVASSPRRLNILGIRDDSSDGMLPTGFLAVKQLHSSSRADFDKEVKILARFDDRPHPHLIKLLATYHWRGNYHLLFPWAQGHLQDFWKSHPSPFENEHAEDRLNILCSILGQCVGLADAFKHLHLHLKIQDNARSNETWPARSHGLHGDIKPQNVLWFDDRDNSHNKDRRNTGVGHFKISDFGLTALHSPDTNRIVPSARGGTETYAGPGSGSGFWHLEWH
ncbi:hypothetical protein LA080_004551 [Diaporthe eres]|nr:hypothetical protein LA080_004551 [Diaporthe eres]